MKTRQLGSTDLFLTEIGFGAWAIGGGNWAFGWGPQNNAEAIAAIRRALELGVNWIDTAAVYGLGHSEELVAQAVKGHRKEVIIATKCSLIWDDRGNITSSLAADSVRRECITSLRRLNTDYIDLYQIHWPNDDERIEEGWETILRLMEEGKIRHGGVSNFRPDHMERALAIHSISSMQPPYSMINRGIEDEILPFSREKDIGIVAYSPLQSGLLTGKFDMDNVAESDWRRRSVDFQEPALSATLELVEGLRPIAEKYDKTIAQLAIAWVLRLPNISSAIVGARRPSQIEETAGGVDWALENEDLRKIDHLLAERKKKIEKAGKKK